MDKEQIDALIGGIRGLEIDSFSFEAETEELIPEPGQVFGEYRATGNITITIQAHNK